MYNTKVFPKAPDSWSVVFEEQTLPDGKSNKGRVQAFDGPIHIADAALYLMSHQPALGIKDPYELNEDQYKAALDLLRQQRQLVGRYWHDAFVQIDDFKNEGVVASGSWPFQANTLIADKQPIATTVPKEGVTGWADTSMVHSEAKNLTCAYKWLEHSLNNKLQGISPPGSAPCRWCRPPARAMPCSGKRGARPTASTTSIECASGVPPSPSARAREPACLTTAGSRTISPSWVVAEIA